MELRVTKLFSFEMAHALDGYDGLCRNIHGHSYKLAVTVCSGNESGIPHIPDSPVSDGMVMDFSCLKRIVTERIIEPFDHALVLSEGSPFPKDLPTKTVTLPFRPTTENLLLHFAALLTPHLPAGIKLHTLRLHETETSYAELVL